MSVLTPLGQWSAGLLRLLDAETAHHLAIRALGMGLVPSSDGAADRRLETRFLGLNLPNPIGLAAGFDKNAMAVDACLKLGFGFVEAGTVTPRPQDGNARPRIFRLSEDRAIINRLGFNNEGHDAFHARLVKRQGRAGVVGVNIGANKDSSDRAADYVLGIRRFAGLASYFTVNVSSPNTPGLRDLQAREALDELLARCIAARDDSVAGIGRKVPVILKIAPDIVDAGLDDIASVALERGVDGLVISNTTLSRSGLSSPLRSESGGMSGRPLFERATIVLARMRERVGADLPIVGVGGICNAADVITKIEAGADVVQVYSGFIFEGPAMVGRICRDLSKELDRRGLSHLSQIKGTTTTQWAGRPTPD